MAEPDPAMRWPTLGHKFGGATFFRWPCWCGFWIDRKNWYYGNYLMVSFGWHAFKCGYGTLDDERQMPAAGGVG